MRGIRAFAEIKEGRLKEKVGPRLQNGLPSHDTIRRVPGMIDPKVFHGLFIKRIEEKLSLKEESYISIDGKTLRGSGNDGKDIAPIRLLHAYSHEFGIVIGQKECAAEKKNEITACPELLDMLRTTYLDASIEVCCSQHVIAVAPLLRRYSQRSF